MSGRIRAALAALAACLLLSACNPQPAHRPPGGTPTPQETPTGLPPLEITSHGRGSQPVRIVQGTGNRTEYELRAASSVSHSAQNVAQAKFMESTVTFFDKDGTRLTASSPVAQIDDKNKQVVMSGGVHAKTSTGLVLTCDRLTYDQRTSLLHGEGNVRITGLQGGEQEVLTGNTFTSDVRLTQMVIR